MKKSTPKFKLSVSRETLRILETPELVVAGVEEGLVISATVRYSNCGSCNTGI
jgi:hypothetical protein